MQPLARALVLVAVGGVYMAAVAFSVSLAASWRAEAAAAARARGASRLRSGGREKRNHARSFSAPDRRFSAPDRRFSAQDRRFSAPDGRSIISGKIIPGDRNRSRLGSGRSVSGRSFRGSGSGSFSGSTPRALTGEDADLDEAIEDVASGPAGPAGPAASVGSAVSPAPSIDAVDPESSGYSGANSTSSERSGSATPWDGGRFDLDEELSAEEFVRRVRETLAASETSDASAQEAREAFAATYAAREDLPDIVEQIEGRLGFVHPDPKFDAATLRGELCGRS